MHVHARARTCTYDIPSVLRREVQEATVEASGKCSTEQGVSLFHYMQSHSVTVVHTAFHEHNVNSIISTLHLQMLSLALTLPCG